MLRKTFIASILLWVGVMPSNLPFYWCPTRQMWIRNHHTPSSPAVYIMPDTSGGGMSRPSDATLTSGNAETSITCHCGCSHGTKYNGHCGNSETTCTVCGHDASAGDCANTSECRCDDQWWRHRFPNCCDCGHSDELYVFDTDGTADDAMALSMILNWTRSNPRKVLAGITCVRGTANVRQATENIIKTLKTNKMCEVPVYAGADSGLADPDAVKFVSQYGNDSFGDFYYYCNIDDEKTCNIHPAVFISKLVRENPDKVTVLCTGPLTNIAIAAHIEPDFYELVKEILYLGGTDTTKVLPESPVKVWDNDNLDLQASTVVFNWPVPPNAPRIRIFPRRLEMTQKNWRNETLFGKETDVVKFLNFAENRVTSDWYCAAPMLACAIIDSTAVQTTENGRCKVKTSKNPSGTTITEMQYSTSGTDDNVVVVMAMNIPKMETIITTHL